MNGVRFYWWRAERARGKDVRRRVVPIDGAMSVHSTDEFFKCALK